MQLALGMPRKHRETAFGQEAESKDDDKYDGADAGQPQPVDVFQPVNKIKEILL
jgi:hypothetical protein